MKEKRNRLLSNQLFARTLLQLSFKSGTRYARSCPRSLLEGTPIVRLHLKFPAAHFLTYLCSCPCEDTCSYVGLLLGCVGDFCDSKLRLLLGCVTVRCNIAAETLGQFARVVGSYSADFLESLLRRPTTNRSSAINSSSRFEYGPGL